MKSLYLILAATAVVVTCKPQHRNDIIWYPVDGEDGVFISTIGEKHRTSNTGKWRSHRRARFSGMEQPLPLSYDPSENYDPSFFHDIQERRPFHSVQKIPPVFHEHQFPIKRPNARPGGQRIPNLDGNEYQEILNEVFEINKNPLAGQGGTNSWNNRPNNEFGGNFWNQNNQWNGQRPGNQWGNPGGQWGNTGNSGQRPGGQWSNTINSGQRPNGQWGNANNSGQRPGGQWGNTDNSGQRPGGGQWGNTDISGQRPGGQWGNTINSGQRPGATRPVEKPTSEWFTPDTKPGSQRPNRPTGQSDKLVFPEQANTSTRPTTTPSNLLPTDPPTLSPCELSCPVTPEFNPVCGTDSVTYSNAGRLKCARMCGKDVRLSHHGNCGRTPFSTPLVSNNPRIFW